ncbi:MAG: hypothetical protein JSR37_02630 [Verrucomicrobia bacterium]|nr:hypothetical protein [Verrucomicrobiota bacterium]MBS0636825.1 hypothetical protein [Verrucomicrobiota bacterium]
MSSLKMIDILIQTSAFIVTLTYNKEKSSEALLEVTPIIQSATKDVGLAEKFFDIISSDRVKDHHFQAFVKGCTKKISEQFWDSSNWETLEALSIEIPNVTCLLYDTAGSLVHMKTCNALNVMRGFRRIEEALFISARGMPLQLVEHDKHSWRRDQNRETRKYFMHHRSR